MARTTDFERFMRLTGRGDFTFELRTLGTQPTSGAFDSVDLAARQIMANNAAGVDTYIGVSIAHDDAYDLLPNNRMTQVTQSIKDTDIVHMLLQYADIDPIVTPDAPPSEDLRKMCIEHAFQLGRALERELGFPESLIVSTGRGAHEYRLIDQPYEHGGANPIRAIIDYVNFVVIPSLKVPKIAGGWRWDASVCKYDVQVGNPSRIMRAPSSVNTKSTPSRERFDIRTADRCSIAHAPEHMIRIPQEAIDFCIAQQSKTKTDHYISLRDTLQVESESERRELQDIIEEYPRAERISRGRSYIKQCSDFVPVGERNQAAYRHAVILITGFVIEPEDAAEILREFIDRENPRENGGFENAFDFSNSELLSVCKSALRSRREESGRVTLGCYLNDDSFDFETSSEIADRLLEWFQSTVTQSAAPQEVADDVNTKKVVKKSKKTPSLRSIAFAPAGEANPFNRVLQLMIDTSANPQTLTAAPLSATIALFATVSSKYFVPFRSFSPSSSTLMFCAYFAPTGSGKDSPLAVVAQMLRDAGLSRMIASSDLQTKQAVDDTLAGAASHGVLYMIDEAGAKFASEGGGRSFAAKSMSTKLPSWYSSRDDAVALNVSNRAAKLREGVKLEDGYKLTISRPCVSFLMSSQPSKFKQIFSQNEAETGWINRFLTFEEGDGSPESVFVGKHNAKRRMLHDTPDDVVQVLRSIVPDGLMGMWGAISEHANIEQAKEDGRDYRSQNIELDHQEVQAFSRFDYSTEINGVEFHPYSEMMNFSVKIKPSFVDGTRKAEDVAFECDRLIEELQIKYAKEGSDFKLSMLPRVVENACRLASLSAIARNPKRPIVQVDEIKWSIILVLHSIRTGYRLSKQNADRNESHAVRSYSTIIHALIKTMNTATDEELDAGYAVSVPDLIEGEACFGYSKNDVRKILKELHEASLVVQVENPDDIANARAMYVARRERLGMRRTRTPETFYIPVVDSFEHDISVLADKIKRFDP